MAHCINPTLVCTINNSLPKTRSISNTIASHKLLQTSVTSLTLVNSRIGSRSGSGRRCTKLKAGLTDIEPDLNEDPKDRWATPGVSPEDFVYGKYDDHHTFFETSEKGTFWGAVVEEYNSMEAPSGLQGIMSWLFLPAVAAGMYYDVPGDYIFIGAGLFVIIFCAFEMAKPDQPHNFEPQIYNMERGARDKLIADYNTMDIWDFNEKYGELWDFTVEHDMSKM
ncbi:hypothetical protein vseg_019768 [Gypsophila vaccaria]